MENDIKETPKDNLSEFEQSADKPVKKVNAPLQVIMGLFFIGYGIFRLSATLPGDGSWNTFFGSALIVLGIIRIGSLFFQKKN